ncbi:MAG: DUF2332 domain-containing protein [Nocardioidaceae bacterium]
MSWFDDGPTLADRMRQHAGKQQHLYGELMRAMATDWEAGGAVREICRGWEDAPRGSVVQLRLLAGLFRIVLTDRAPELVPFYPCLGGTRPPHKAWPAVRDVLAANVEELHEALLIAPQTNEAGRSTALLVGLFEAVRRTGLRRVQLLEPGASAGLNLLVDKFRFVHAGWAFGPASSPLQLANVVVGATTPEPFEIVQRRGCDLSPVDASTPDGQLRLRSFVWPFQVERHVRLAQALEIAAESPVTVERAAAGEWLEHELAQPLPEDVLTVVWQSITKLYWPAQETARVDDAILQAASSRPVAHLAMEYPTVSASSAELTLTGLDGAAVTRLATVGDHGTPVTIAPR